MFKVTQETPCVDKISSFKKDLYPYQLSTIFQMERLENKDTSHEGIHINTSIGILSNKVGSGKSIIILGLCKRNKKDNKECYENVITPLFNVNNNNYINNFIYSENIRGINLNNLIVAPSSIIKQWEKELKQTDLTYFIIKSKSDIIKIDDINLKNYDIVLCSNTFFNCLVDKTYSYKWNRVIIDEADSIRAINHTVSYSFLWVVTATPELLYASKKKSFIGNIFYNISNYMLNYIKVICDEDYISMFSNAIINKNCIKCLTPLFLNILNNHISNDIKELINAGDLETAVLRLGGDIKTDKDLITLFNQKTFTEISDLKLKIDYTSKINNLSKKDKEIAIKKITDKIISLETQLDSIKEKINEINKDNCSICLEKFINPVMTKCCNNIFCFDCIKSSLSVKQSCVFCRSSLYLKDLTMITDKVVNPVVVKKQKLLTKDEQCIKILKNKHLGKFLIFSNHSFNNLKMLLDDNNLYNAELKGGKDTVERVIKKYKTTNDFNILLMNAQHKGAGINLENTTDIIIYHNLPISLEKQVIGRVLRINRELNLPLNIHYLKHENE